MKKIRIWLLLFLFLLVTGLIVGSSYLINIYGGDNKILWWFIFFGVDYIIKAICAIFIFESKKRVESSKIAWLFALFIPFYGTILYFVYGINPMQYGLNQERIKNMNDSIKQIESENGLDTVFNFAINKNNACASKNNIQYLFDNKKTNKQIINLINTAKNNIFLQLHTINKKYFKETILPLLIKKANEGIKIFVLYDWFISYTKKLCRLTKKINNFYTNIFNPKVVSQRKTFWNLSLINSMIIIDNNQMLYGAFILDDPKHLHEINLNLLFSGPIINDFQNIYLNNWQFLSIWKKDNEILKNSTTKTKLVATKQNLTVSQCIHFDMSDTQMNFSPLCLNAIYQAKKSIKLLSNDFITESNVINHFKFIAAKNIDVKIITSSCKSKIVNSYEEYCNNNVNYGAISFYKTNKKIKGSYLIIDDYLCFFIPSILNFSAIYHSSIEIALLKIENNNLLKRQFDEILKTSSLFDSKTYKRPNWFKKMALSLYKVIYPIL